MLHYAWVSLASHFRYSVDFRSLLVFLTGYSEEKSDLFAEAIQSAARSSQQIAWYFLTLYLASATLGFVSNIVVAWFGLDGAIPLLRQRNHWSYLLSGRLSCFTELEQDFGGRPVYGVFATAIVRCEEGSYLYRGLIVDWVCRSNGELDRIIMEAVRRRKLADDRKPWRMRSPSDYHLRFDKRYYEVDGDYFTLQYSDISTLNIEYVPDFRLRQVRRRFPMNWWEFRRVFRRKYLKGLGIWRFFVKRRIRPYLSSWKTIMRGILDGRLS